MDVGAAEEAAGHAQEPAQQEQHVQSDIAGAGGSESVEAGIEAIRTADEITLATVHVHEAGLQGAAEPTTQTLSSGLEEATQ